MGHRWISRKRETKCVIGMEDSAEWIADASCEQPRSVDAMLRGMAQTDQDLRFPIGPFDFAAQVDPNDAPRWIAEIAALPAELRSAVAGLGDAELDTPYRDGGWTVRQVVHHLPDSQLNGYVRLRLALTEDCPVIRPYDQALWAELPDACTAPVELSLDLLEAVIRRWVALLEILGPTELARTWQHPEEEGLELRIDTLLAIYAWHGRHHVAQIRALRERRGWTAS